MKTIRTLLIVVLILLLNWQAQAERGRSIARFDEISLRVAANLYLEQGNERSLEITANEATLDKLIVEVLGGKLIIRFSVEDWLFGSFKPGKIDIRLVADEPINALNIQGSGNIIATSAITTPFITLNIAGSGDIKMSELETKQLDVNITGSGDVVISGTEMLDEIHVNIAGSGDVMAYQLQAREAFVRIAGSGDCDLYVSELLDAKILGSGDVNYRGEPALRTSISGSGRVKSK